jgi:hypothetical protein
MLRRLPAAAAGTAALAAAAVALQGRASRAQCDAPTAGGGSTDARPTSVELHCSPISPTCARYKAFFTWQRIQTKAVDTMPLGDTISSVVVDGAEVADLQALVARVRASNRSSKAPIGASEEEEHWVGWVDEKLIPHVLVNVFRSPEEATQAMDVAVKRGGFNVAYAVFLRQLAAYYLYVSAQRSKRKLEVRAPVNTRRGVGRSIV